MASPRRTSFNFDDTLLGIEARVTLFALFTASRRQYMAKDSSSTLREGPSMERV
jgi:hypothetical protein